MENRRPLIVTGLVLILILALIAGVVFYLINFIRSRQTASTTQLFPKASVSASARATGGVVATPVSGGSTSVISTNPNIKVYNGVGFQVQYPKAWGLLTCSNSTNFELDPTAGTDQLNVVCDHALKPVTFLVGQFSCSGGNVITLGGFSVRKVITQIQTTTGGNGTEYHWCTNTTPALDVTHRVGTGPAFSSTDYSAQVEQVIATLRTGSGS